MHTLKDHEPVRLQVASCEVEMLRKKRNQFRGRTIIGYSARVIDAGLLRNGGDVVLRCAIMQ
jgi:hypothetical protein